jgi:outer membrane protein OmpA-like peptidoglycan-associated protein
MEESQAPRQYRVVGEKTPRWVSYALALLGVLGSVVTAYLLIVELQLLAWLPGISGREGKQVTSIAPPSQISLGSEPIPAPKVVEKPGAVSAQPGVAGVPDCPPLFTVLFASDSARPLGMADLLAKTTALRAWLNAHPEARLLVDGHTDSRGSRQFNLQLSSQRAEAVAALLIAAGVPRRQLVTRAFGEEKPLSRIGSAGNRRVSLQVEDFNECPKNEGKVP